MGEMLKLVRDMQRREWNYWVDLFNTIHTKLLKERDKSWHQE